MRLFAGSSPPNINETAQIIQLQCDQLMKEFRSLIPEEVVIMLLEEAHAKSEEAHAKSDRALETTRSRLFEMVADQNSTIAGPSNDPGQPSGSLPGPPRIDTPPFQVAITLLCLSIFYFYVRVLG